jgi:deoxycytidylate deaminase|uniref:CMP/dCMP-type deaminase domain-containing protein n=1 Tax=viral metagenome TaxID=1070528 RepID=A0A6C0KGF3_9ZZZZ
MSRVFHTSRLSYKIYNATRNESMKPSGDTKQNLACTIVKNGQIVVTGRNFRSFGTTQTCCCHAEMDAIYQHLKISRKWEMFHFILKNAYRATSGPLTRIPGKAS